MPAGRLPLAALALAAIATIFSGACGSPPDKEIQQAQGALDAARAAGAEQYARAEYTAAEEALKRAREAVEQRDYQAALNSALDSRERAQNAAKEAADGKATARGDADRALSDATTALNVARGKLKTAEGARIPAKTLAKPRQTISDGEQTLQKARAAFGTGDYLGATKLANTAAGRLVSAGRDLDAVATIMGRRRR
jgi:flagellar hook-basal body complex protein FliE